MDLVNYLNANTITKEFLIKMCKEFKLKFKFDKTLDKILFYNDSMLTSINPINKFANSMIVELVEGEYKVVCFPTQYYCNRTLFNKTEQFNIYPIYDGTIVNVYYSLLENKWLFGTHKSFNICESVWRGLSWQSVIDKIDLQFDELDKSKTYTYNIQNIERHIFNTKNDFRLIAISSPTSMEFFGEIEISNQEVFETCENSINNYINGGTPVLGYIYRNERYCFIFKSRLMTIITDLLYRIPYSRNKKFREEFIKYNNDILFIISKCYLYDRELCSIMFPMFEKEFKKLDHIMVSLVNYIELVLSPHNYEGTMPKIELMQLFKIYYEKNSINLKKLKNRRARSAIRNYVVNNNKDVILFYRMLKASF